MKRIMMILMVITLSLVFIGCDLISPEEDTKELDDAKAALITAEADLVAAKADISTLETDKTQSDADLIEAITDLEAAENQVFLIQDLLSGILFDSTIFTTQYVENIAAADVSITSEYNDSTVSNALNFSIDWAESNNTKAYIGVFPTPAFDATTEDSSIMAVKIKLPTEFIDGDDNNQFAGVKLFIKDATWTESSVWFGAWNIKDAIDGNSQAGIKALDDGFVLLTVNVPTQLNQTWDGNDVDPSTINQYGIVMDQNSDESLTSDMKIIIDYIEFQ